MDNSSLWLVAAVGIPIFGSFLIPVFNKIFPKKGGLFAFFLGGATFLAVIRIILAVAYGETVIYHLPLPLNFNLTLEADYMAAFMAFVSSSLSFVIVYYSLGYITHYKHQMEYYVMVLMFLGAMMGLVFSVNLVWMFIFWEITAICSWRLVGFFRGEKDILKADKTFLVTVFGALCLLLGIIAIYVSKGTVDLRQLKGETIPEIAFFLIILGIFSKSATLPFSTWLPDAGVAPSPVTALLHAAVLVKIGVYAYARIFCATLQPDPSWGFIVAVIAGLSAIIAAGAALTETDIKRIIAYSTISQIGFIFLGLATNTRIGVAGAMLYILMHGVAKGGLFLCAGIIEHRTHTKDITKMGGLLTVMPITAAAFAFCALSIMGIPPFGGFFSKFMIFRSAAAIGSAPVFFMYVVCALMTMLYLFRLFYSIFLGANQNWGHAKEGAFEMVSSVALLGLASLALGLAIYYPAYFAEVLCTQIGMP